MPYFVIITLFDHLHSKELCRFHTVIIFFLYLIIIKRDENTMNFVLKAITSKYLQKCVRNSYMPLLKYLSAAPPNVDCWKCQYRHDCKVFCPSCDTIQCTNCTTTKLNYFQLLNVKQTYDIDAEKIKQFYFQLQCVLHPDRFINKSDIEQDYSLTQSALLSNAYKTLLDPIKRAIHLLELNHEEIDKETVSSENKALLADIFMLNFEVEESEDSEKLRNILISVNNDIEADKQDISNGFSENSFERVKESLIKLRYRANISAKIEDKLLQLSL